MHEILTSIRGRKNTKNTMLLTQFYRRADIKIFAVRDSFFAVNYAIACALNGASLCKTHSRTPHLNPAQHVSTEPNRFCCSTLRTAATRTSCCSSSNLVDYTTSYVAGKEKETNGCFPPPGGRFSLLWHLNPIATQKSEKEQAFCLIVLFHRFRQFEVF